MVVADDIAHRQFLVISKGYPGKFLPITCATHRQRVLKWDLWL